MRSGPTRSSGLGYGCRASPGRRDPVPAGDDSAVRAYTARRVPTDASEIRLDFVVHGEEGVAGPWARTVQHGASVVVSGAWRLSP
ncbi:siderophore-interacting protein [Dietzia lutea]|uniref:siderophore-interacting protein n=1 Tax=Dietzia lutea TaxID=546160 RepID=UPI000D55873A|nr:siderophore-interacting protein [Dietzia lutea]